MWQVCFHILIKGMFGTDLIQRNVWTINEEKTNLCVKINMTWQKNAEYNISSRMNGVYEESMYILNDFRMTQNECSPFKVWYLALGTE